MVYAMALPAIAAVLGAASGCVHGLGGRTIGSPSPRGKGPRA